MLQAFLTLAQADASYGEDQKRHEAITPLFTSAAGKGDFDTPGVVRRGSSIKAWGLLAPLLPASALLMRKAKAQAQRNSRLSNRDADSLRWEPGSERRKLQVKTGRPIDYS